MGLFKRHKSGGEPRGDAARPGGGDVAELTKLGVGHLTAERWSEAIEPLDAALAGGSQVAHLYLAQAYANLGNGDAARHHYEAVLATSPADAAELAGQYRWLDAGRELKSLGTAKEGAYTYETYACADLDMAQEFLLGRDVDRPLFYVDVETPDGLWGADIDGIYQGHLPDWKKDLDLAECDVRTQGAGPLGEGSLEKCAKGISDNFVVKVGCGRCGHEWIAALRYQDLTVARCPSCAAYNRIDSHIYVVVLLGEDETPASIAERMVDAVHESGPGEAASSSKGVDTLVELTGPGILFPSTYVDRAVEELRVEGEPGSRALAALIREMLACRSPVILDALEVARQVVPVPELLDALHAVENAPEMAEEPARARFAPEIVGSGRVAWTSRTHMIAGGRAMDALRPRDQGD